MHNQNLSLVWSSTPTDVPHIPSSSSTVSEAGARSSSSASPVSVTPSQSRSPERVLYSPTVEHALTRWQYWAKTFVAAGNKAPKSMSDLWSVVIPQLGWRHEPLRHFMTATGIIADSLLRNVGTDTDRAQLIALSYVNRGIQLLREGPSSAFVILVTAWTLWQFDLMRGETRGALVHLKNGRLMAASKELSMEIDDKTEHIVEGVLNAMQSDLVSLVTEEMFAELGTDTAKKKSFVVATVAVAEGEMAEAYWQVSQSTSPSRAELMEGLTMLRQEMRWLKTRWQLGGQAYKGDVPSLFGECLPTLRAHLLGVGDLDTAAFLQFLGRHLTFFSVQVSGADRQMRLDVTMLLRYREQLRKTSNLEIG